MSLSSAVFFLCLASAIMYIAGGVRRRLISRFAAILNAGSAVCLALLIVLRSVELGFPALTSTYEALLFFSLALVSTAFILNCTGQSILITAGLLITALVFLILASSPLFPSEPKPPVPALRSYWLVLHVAFAFIGEGLFAAAFISSILWFISGEDKKKKFEKSTYITILAGYPFFTLGALVFGAVWAATAWGRFWSWDPKETWALITWLTYTFYLHARFISKSSPRLTNLISILGFIFTLVTFLGLKFISAFSGSLHLY